MRPVRVSLTGSPDSSDVIPIDQYLTPTNISINVEVTGTITWFVEHTYDDVWDSAFNPATAQWVQTATGVDVDGEVAVVSPPIAFRLRTSAGAGTAAMTLVQAGAAS